MPQSDLLVIGGGIVGLVTAIQLTEAGASVRIVDAGQNAGSTANAGSLHVQMQSRFMRLYPEQVPNIEASLPYYKAATARWHVLDQAHGPFELVRKGGLMLAESDEQMRFLETKAERERAKGISAELLDRAALDRIAPWLGPQIVGAELCHDEGKLNPLAANLRLRAHAERLGVEILTDEIVGLEVSGGGAIAQGKGAQYAADRVVIAAAWGSGALVQGLGVSIPSRAEPLHMNITEAGAPQIQHLIQHAERSITLKQLGGGQVVIGGGWPARDLGRRRPPKVEVESLLGNVALAGRLVPSIGGLRVLRTWAGMNTTVDGASVIGRLPSTDRVIMAIPGDAGYTLGPLVAQMVAELVLGQTPAHDPAPFSPARFRDAA
ncbi:MAG: FAD-dependent oxidoreductase [Pseudomonadota bacterium]